MVIKLTYKCDDPKQEVTITLLETATEGCKVTVQAYPLLMPGLPNPYGVLEKFLAVLDQFELPVREPKNDNADA